MSSLLNFLLFNAVIDDIEEDERLDLQVDKGVHKSVGSSYEESEDSEE